MRVEISPSRVVRCADTVWYEDMEQMMLLRRSQ